MAQASKVSVLRMPLDLSVAVDKEIYDIVSGFKSGVEAKNFLCSAVLYYARSPLVLSANALSDKLDEIKNVLSGLDFSYTGLQLEKILSRLGDVDVGQFSPAERLSEVKKPAGGDKVFLDSVTVGALSSLRNKFKV